MQAVNRCSSKSRPFKVWRGDIRFRGWSQMYLPRHPGGN